MTGIGKYRIRYDEEDGRLERSGTDTPRGAVVVAHDGALIVAKIPGSHYYGGQGQPFRYAPAEFVVYEVEREDGDGWLLCRERASWPVRQARLVRARGPV